MTAKPTDFNDLHQQEGLNGVKQQIEAATQPKETDKECYERLAKLTPADYDRCRDAESKRLGIRSTTLDEEVSNYRFRTSDSAPVSVAKLADSEPWPDPVDGAALLDGLAAEYRKFLVLPRHADTVLALWALHTYSWEWCEYSPILAITSPTKSCGKSRVLDVLEKLVSTPFRTGNMSEAVLFRVLHSRKPSVLIDEFDTIPEDRRDALANILKHGFHVSGRVHRVEGEGTKTVTEFNVFAPKALACIRLSTLDGATISRCINIRMQRKKPGEKVERLRRYDGTGWKRKSLRWTEDHREQIESATAEMPDALSDREQDIYEPLFVLANLAGGDWPRRIKEAGLALSGESMESSPDTPVLLLEWIRTHFNETKAKKVSSAALVQWLNDRQDAPFAAWNDHNGIKQIEVRRHLAGFVIQPDTVRLDSKTTAKGYDRDWFDDAFSAYLADPFPKSGNTVTSAANIGRNDDFTPVTEESCYWAETAVSSNKDGHCYSVTAQSPKASLEITKAPSKPEQLAIADLI
jgi:putative DNA primase/helicase